MTKKAVFQQGFSLIELAIVLVISGLLMAGATTVYSQYLQKRVMAVTNDNMNFIRASLGEFYTQNGRYPCPAPPGLQPENPAAGKERCPASVTLMSGFCDLDGLCREKGIDADQN